MSNKMKVAIRVRPLNDKEKLDNLALHWKTNGNSIFQIDPVTGRPKSDAFNFDHVFNESKTNNEVFDQVVKPIVDASMQGFNGTVFAYGQTSSGKTFTMSGTHKDLGIIPLTINYIFYSIENTPGREFLLRVSYVEIYNEKVNDLLEIKKKNLKLHEDMNGQVVVDVEERVCKSSQEVLEEKYKGDKSRRIGVTNMNERSSRSHTIFRIILESRTTDDEEGAVKVSHLNLVDLAGSERAGQSGATGDRFREGCHINSSLTTLGLVINQLSEGQEGQFINFRDSKLTRLLQSSLGGNAMTAVICAVTPAAEDQTQNTINFAIRAKNIKMTPILNEVLSDAALIKRYLRQIAKLSQELEDIKQKNVTVDVQEMEDKLKEKEELNERLNMRISRMKEALIVSSSSPVYADKSKMRNRSRRRMTWGGQFDRRSLFPSNSPTLGTIAEDSLIPSTPQASSTRLDEIICPFEKFELELMKDKDSFWGPHEDQDEFFEDARENDTTASNTTKFSDAIMNLDSEYDETLTGHIVAEVFKEPETPPAVLRQRIHTMSNTLTNVIKDYDELREYTTLEKQLLGNDNCAKHLRQLTILTQQNHSLTAALQEKTAAYNILQEKFSELEKLQSNSKEINFMEEELNELKEHNLFLQNEIKLKSESHHDLLKQFEEININVSLLSEEKIKIQQESNDLERKIQTIEKKNLDLEVTLDLNKKKSVERISELEKELKTAWETLEKRGQNFGRVINKSKSSERLQYRIEDEVTKMSHEDNSNETVSEDQDQTDYLSNETAYVSVQEPEADIRFVSCDMTLTADQSITNTAPVDPLKSFCLNDSMIPINVSCTEKEQVFNETIEHCNFEVKNNDNDQLIKELCSIINENLGINITGSEIKDSVKEILQKNSDLKVQLVSLESKMQRDCDLIKELRLKAEDSNENNIIVAELVEILRNEWEIDSGKDNVCYVVKDVIQKNKLKEDEMFKLSSELEKRQSSHELLNNMCEMLQKHAENIDLNNINDVIQSLLNSEAELAEVQKKLEANKDGEFILGELCSLLKGCMEKEICKEDLIDSAKLLILNNDDLKQDVNNAQTLYCETQKEYSSKIQQLKNELEETDDLLKRMCIALTDKLETNVSKNELLDTVVSLVHYKDKYTRMSVSMEENKEFSDIVNNLFNILREDLDETAPKNKIEDVIVTLKKNNIELKKQLQDGQKVTNETESELKNKINTIKAELEVNKLYETIVNDVCSVLSETESENDNEGVTIDKVKNAVLSLKETNEELKNRLDILQNVNIETETQYKSEIDMLKSELQTGKVYETVMDDLLCVLRDESANPDLIDVKNAVVALKEDNFELRKTLTQLQVENSEHLKNVEKLKSLLDESKIYEAIVHEVCFILQENSETAVEKDNVVDIVKSLKCINGELKKMLEGAQSTNQEMMLTEIDVLKTKAELSKEFKEIVESVCDILNENSEKTISKDEVINAVKSLKETAKKLSVKSIDVQVQYNAIETQCIGENKHLKEELELSKGNGIILDEICKLLEDDSGKIGKDEVKNVILSMKNDLTVLKTQLTKLENEGNEKDKLCSLEISALKTELDKKEECENILDGLCSVLQEESELIITRNVVNNVIINLQENVKQLEKQLDDMKNVVVVKESEICSLKIKLDETVSHTTLVNDLCSVFKNDSCQDISSEEIKNSVLHLKTLVGELQERLDYTLQTMNEQELNYNTKLEELRNKLEGSNEYENIFNDLCQLLQDNTEKTVTKENIKIIAMSLKEDFSLLKDKHDTELKDLNCKLTKSQEYENIVNDLCQLLQCDMEETVTKENIKNIAMSLKEDFSLLKDKHDAELNDLNCKLTKSQEYENIVNDLCQLLQCDTEETVTKENIKNIAMSLKEDFSLLKDKHDAELNDLNCKLTKSQEYENIVNDLCQLLQCDTEETVTKENIKNIAMSLKEDFSLLKDKHDAELNDLNCKLTKSQEYENIVNDLCQLQCDTEETVTKENIKNIAMSLKEDFSLLKDKHDAELNDLNCKLTKSQEYGNIVNDLCQLLQCDTEETVTKENIKNIAMSLKEDFSLLKDKHDAELNDLNCKLTKSQEYENIVNDLCQLLQCDTDESVTKENIKNIAISLKDNFISLKDKYENIIDDLRSMFQKETEKFFVEDDLKNIVRSLKDEFSLLKDQHVIELEQMNSKLEKSETFENIINDLCLILREDEKVVTKDELKNVVISLKNDISSMQDQHHIECQGINSKLEECKKCEDIINDLCLIFQEKSESSVTMNELKTIVINLKDEVEKSKNSFSEKEIQFVNEQQKNEFLERHNAELMMQLESIKAVQQQTKENYESQVKELENKLDNCKVYENIVAQIQGIVDEEANFSLDSSLVTNSSADSNSLFCSIKNSIVSLKAENAVLITELNETRNQKKMEIDSLKEKLDSYVACVDICYDLCNILNDVNDKKITKDEIRDVVLSLKKSNKEFKEELNTIKSSYSDSNSFAKGEIERLENKLRQAANYETIVAKLCSLHFKIHNEEISKDELVEFIQQLYNNNKQLQDEINDRNETIDLLKSEILKLENGIEICEKYENIVTEICKLFADSTNNRITKDEVSSYVLQLKNNCTVLQNQMFEIKNDYSELKSKCFLQLEGFKSSLDSQMKFEKIVYEIVDLVLHDSSDISDVVESVRSLKNHSEDLEKEIADLKFMNEELDVVKKNYDQISCELKDVLKTENSGTPVESLKLLKNHYNELEKEMYEIKMVNDRLTAEKEDYDQIFDGLKDILELDRNFNESEITEVVISLKKTVEDLQNQLVSEMSNKDKIVKLSAENENLLQKLDELNSCLDFIKPLSNILNLNDGPSLKSDMINAVIALKEGNSQLNDKLITLEARNEVIIEKLNTACEDLKNKLQMCQQNDLILATLKDFLTESYKCNIEKTKILETVKALKAKHTDMDFRINILVSENESKKILETENLDMKSMIQSFKSNEDAVRHLFKELCIDCPGNKDNFMDLIKKLKQCYDTLQEKLDVNAADHKCIVENLQKEIDGLKAKMREIELASAKEISEGLKKVESENKIAQLENAVDDLKRKNSEFQKWKDTDDNIRKKLVVEIRNLKPSFNSNISKDYSSVQLIDDFISFVMEKETEIVSHLQKNFQAENQKLLDKINQLKDEKDKLKQWNQQLEEDVICNLNQELNSKSEKIEGLVNKCKGLQDEITQKSEEVSRIKQKLLESENEAVNLHSQVNELQIKVNNEGKIETLNSLCDELKKEIKGKEEFISSINKTLDEKESVIDMLQSSIELKDSDCRKLSESLKELKIQLSRQASMISELEKCKEIYTNEITKLKFELKEKSNECSDLRGSLAVLREDYTSAKQCLENKFEGTTLLQTKLDEVTVDLETTKSSLQNLRESMKAEKANTEKERLSLLTTIEDINRVCKKMEQELSRLRKENEEIEDFKTKIKNLEEGLASKERELQEEIQLKNLKIKECQEIRELLKVKENLCSDFEKNISSLAHEVTAHRDTVIKLKMDLKNREEEIAVLLEQNKEKLKCYENLENDLKFEKQHSKKLRLKNESLQRKLDVADQKENKPSVKTFSPGSNSPHIVSDSSIYAEKLKSFEKDLFSVFDTPPKSLENALKTIQSTFDRVKNLETQLAEVEMDKNDLDRECEDMSDHIKLLNKEIVEYLEKQDALNKNIDELKAELQSQREIIENMKKCNEQYNKDNNWLHTENERLKQSIKEMRNEKKYPVTPVSEKHFDGASKDLLSTPSEFKSLKNKWEQITKSTSKINQNADECKCDELAKHVQELKLDLGDKNSKIAMLEIQIQGENFPYKKKAMQLEESLHESKTKIMALKQEVRRLQSCLHEVTVFNDCDMAGKSANRKTCNDIAVQASLSFDAQDQECSTSGIVQRQSVNLLREKISKMERESVLLKRLCRDRNKRIEILEQELKKLGVYGKVK